MVPSILVGLLFAITGMSVGLMNDLIETHPESQTHLLTQTSPSRGGMTLNKMYTCLMEDFVWTEFTQSRHSIACPIIQSSKLTIRLLTY